MVYMYDSFLIPSSVYICTTWASQVALVVKNLLASAGDIRDMGSVPGVRKIPWKGK